MSPRMKPPTILCQKCKKTVPWNEHWNTDNGLEMHFIGGYGEFVDTAFDETPAVWLCHECGHDLADWLGLDVRNWHTHIPPDLGGTQHADHHTRRGVPDERSTA